MNENANVSRLSSTLATIETMFLHLQEDLKKIGLDYEMLQVALWPAFEEPFSIRLWNAYTNCPFDGGHCSFEGFIEWYQRKLILKQSFDRLRSQLKERKV